MKLAVLSRSARGAFGKVLPKMRVLWAMLLAVVLLSGCVQYDAGVRFENPNRGEIVQHIKLGEQLTALSSEQAQEWLDSLQRRARQLQGKTKRISNQEVVVTIPFASGAELEEKFNQFFNPPAKKGSQAATDTDLPKINSHLSLRQGNFLFWIRNHLSYDLDLRSLGVLSTNGNVIVSPGSLFDLDFSLRTPWGARSVEKAENALNPVISEKGHLLVWTLKPGEVNHVEAVFWLPSPLGIGTLAIILLVVAGFYLKYNRGKGSGVSSAPPSVPQVQ
ncbi:DUF3153 domain-containing protein [Coleofasciculus sp. FACHB-SPT36]|uniref:DUF3153 domain-containing protein n=1 Tax=Cyanophyceae TaxID=3028117 RepID=UPI00321FFC78